MTKSILFAAAVRGFAVLGALSVTAAPVMAVAQSESEVAALVASIKAAVLAAQADAVAKGLSPDQTCANSQVEASQALSCPYQSEVEAAIQAAIAASGASLAVADAALAQARAELTGSGNLTQAGLFAFGTVISQIRTAALGSGSAPAAGGGPGGSSAIGSGPGAGGGGGGSDYVPPVS